MHINAVGITVYIAWMGAARALGTRRWESSCVKKPEEVCREHMNGIKGFGAPLYFNSHHSGNHVALSDNDR